VSAYRKFGAKSASKENSNHTFLCRASIVLAHLLIARPALFLAGRNQALSWRPLMPCGRIDDLVQKHKGLNSNWKEDKIHHSSTEGPRIVTEM
jgi:hypothetical protein